MFVSTRNLTFACILLLSIQQVALAVTCYSCTLCDSVSSSTKTETGAVCYKVVVSGNGKTVVSIRGASNTCPDSTDGEVSGITTKTHCCSSDKCNSGIALSSSLGLAFAFVAAVLTIKSTMNH